jgi:CMP/dCMP kinase
MNNLIITIDGPAASGKSSVAQRVARALACTFLDTGAMYRGVTLLAMKSGTPLTDVQAILRLIDSHVLAFAPGDSRMTVSIDGRDVTEEIRDPQVTVNICIIAEAPELRRHLVDLQRDFARQYPRLVTEGRDQGTVVFPDANLKFFLTANALERAKRRQLELKAKGIESDLQTLKQAVESRDLSDQQRAVGPLKRADDAIDIDTTGLTLTQVVDTILNRTGELAS